MSATDNSDSGNQSSEHKTLPFFFTPVDEPRPGETNPHAQASTYAPDVVEALQARFGEGILEIEEYAGEQTIFVERGLLLEVATFLRSDLGFAYFVHCGAIDRFTEEDRFEMFYNVVNIEQKKRLRIKVRVPEDDPVVASVTPVWRAADWHEREAWDMMGIRFEGHGDLRRMLMPEDFEYHPQRKEFPLLGVPGSLPLPPQVPEGPLTLDPFAAAHGHKPPKSYLEPSSSLSDN